MKIFQKKGAPSATPHFLHMFSFVDRMEDNATDSKRSKFKTLVRDKGERAFCSDIVASSILMLYKSQLLPKPTIARFYDLLLGAIKMRYTEITAAHLADTRPGVAIIFGAAEQSIRNDRVHAFCDIIVEGRISISYVILSGAKPPDTKWCAECDDESQAMYVELVSRLKEKYGARLSDEQVDQTTMQVNISSTQGDSAKSLVIHKESESKNTSQNIHNSLGYLNGICQADTNALLISSALHLFRLSSEFERELYRYPDLRARIGSNMCLVASDDALENISSDDQADLVYLKTMLWEIYYNLVLSDFNAAMQADEDKEAKWQQRETALRSLLDVRDSQIVREIRQERRLRGEQGDTDWGEKQCQRMLAQCFSSFVYDKREKAQPRRVVDTRKKKDGVAVTGSNSLNDVELTEMFLSCYYKKPDIESMVDENVDLLSVLFDSNNEHNSVYLYSNPGDGKSIFLSHFNLELNAAKEHRSVVFDTEEFQNNAEYENRDRTEIRNFWAYVYHKLTELENGRTGHNPDLGKGRTGVLDYIRSYDKRATKTMILVFDNLDAFHYNVERHLFSEPCHCGKRKFNEERTKVPEIVNTIVGCIKTCSKVKAIFSLRDYSLSLLNDSIHIKDDYKLHLKSPSSITVLTQRMAMLRDIINGDIPIGVRNQAKIASPIRIKAGTKKAFNAYFEAFFNPSKTPRGKRSPHDIYRGLHELSSQGWRSVVKLLSKHIRFELEKDGHGEEKLNSDMRAFFSGDIRLLFILDMFNRYAQVLSDKTLQRSRITHFPNMFLIRAMKSDEIRHKKPIYFLKLLVMLLVDARNETGITEEDVYLALCPPEGGGYEKDIVQLVLGSLAATNESNCLTVDFAHSSPLITLTDRGKALLSPIHRMRKQEDYRIPYCLHFECLQFFCDDYYLLRPTAAEVEDNLVNDAEARKHITSLDKDYSYLGHSLGEKRAKSKVKLLRQKVYRVLFFTYFLEGAQKYEMKLYPAAWQNLKKKANDCSLTNAYFKDLFVAENVQGFWQVIRSEIVSTYNVFRGMDSDLKPENALTPFCSQNFDDFFERLSGLTAKDELSSA